MFHYPKLVFIENVFHICKVQMNVFFASKLDEKYWKLFLSENTR